MIQWINVILFFLLICQSDKSIGLAKRPFKWSTICISLEVTWLQHFRVRKKRNMSRQEVSLNCKSIHVMKNNKNMLVQYIDIVKRLIKVKSHYVKILTLYCFKKKNLEQFCRLSNFWCRSTLQDLLRSSSNCRRK